MTTVVIPATFPFRNMTLHSSVRFSPGEKARHVDRLGADVVNTGFPLFCKLIRCSRCGIKRSTTIQTYLGQAVRINSLPL